MIELKICKVPSWNMHLAVLHNHTLASTNHVTELPKPNSILLSV